MACRTKAPVHPLFDDQVKEKGGCGAVEKHFVGVVGIQVIAGYVSKGRVIGKRPRQGGGHGRWRGKDTVANPAVVSCRRPGQLHVAGRIEDQPEVYNLLGRAAAGGGEPDRRRILDTLKGALIGILGGPVIKRTAR